MKACCRNLIVRVAFYGLMILGPTFLSIGHSYYVKAKQQRVDLSEISQTGDKCNSNELRCGLRCGGDRLLCFLVDMDKHCVNCQNSRQSALEKLQALKKSMLVNMFPQGDAKVPKIRFRGFEGEWRDCILRDILTIGNGRDYKHLSSGTIPVYGTGGYMTSVSDFLYEGESVCIGRKGTIDRPMYLNGKFWTVDTLFYTYQFKGVEPYYLYSNFQTSTGCHSMLHQESLL